MQTSMRESLLALTHTLFKVRPEELKRTGYAFVYLFAAIGAFIIGRIARTVLFLEIPNYREQLPMVYVGIAIAVSLTMVAYARVERSLRRDRTNAITLAVLALATLGFRLTLNHSDHAVYWAFYIWVEILGAFLIVQFWSLANEIFHSRQAKRLFAVIGGGGVLANVFIGFAISRSVHVLGTENLLYLIALCLVVSLAMVLLLGREASSELATAKSRVPPRVTGRPLGGQPVFATRHVRLIAAVVVLTYLASYVLDYQFNVIVGDTIAGKDDRSAYLGNFFAVTGIVGGIVQFFLTARFIERFGMLASLIILPIAMLLGSTLLGVAPVAWGLWAVSFTKGSENVLRYTLNDTTLQLLYLPLPPQVRGRAKTLIDGILKPVSIGAAGVLLALLVGQLDRLVGTSLGFAVSVHKLSYLVGGAIVVWLLVLVGLRREYVKSLMQTLQRRRLNLADATFQINDPAMAKILETTLVSPNVEEVLQALELLPNVSSKIREPLDQKAAGLLRHPSDVVRVAALDYLGTSSARLHADAVGLLLDDPAADVRASATLALCSLRREEAFGRIHHMLEDPDAKVRAHAVAGLIKHGGLDGILACAEKLRRMLASENDDERALAAWVLGEIGVQQFYQPLMPLLSDANDAVRHAAVVAAGRLKSPDLVPHLLRQLADPRLGGAAVQALIAYGPSILDTVSALLAEVERPARVRALATKILARLPDPASADILCRHLNDRNPELRAAVVHALTALKSRLPALPLDLAQVAIAIRAAAADYVELLALSADLAIDEHVPLLNDALQYRLALTQGRLLALLSLKYPGDTIDLVRRNLKSSQMSIRANAVEVVDNLIDKEERTLVLPLIDNTSPPEAKLQAGSAVMPVRRSDRLARLRELLSSGDGWLPVVAAMAAAEWGLKNLVPELRELTTAKTALARETAVVALRQLADLEIVRSAVTPLEDDPDPTVRRYAEFALKETSKRSPGARPGGKRPRAGRT